MQSIRGIEALRGARIPLADLLPITPLLGDALGVIARLGRTRGLLRSAAML